MQKKKIHIILNEFYSPTSDKVGAGTVAYELNTLKTGKHTISIKAWDILNNSSEASTEFMVSESEEGFITDLFNYPNPFTEFTSFSFEHDLVNSNLLVEIEIFSLSGQLVSTIKRNIFSSGSKVDNLHWEKGDGSMDKLSKGLYIYKINIHSNELNLSRESNFEKLLILK